MATIAYKQVDDKFYSAIRDGVNELMPREVNHAMQKIEARVTEDVEEYLEEMENEFLEYEYRITRTPDVMVVVSFSKYTKTEQPDPGVSYEIVRLTKGKTGSKLEIY